MQTYSQNHTKKALINVVHLNEGWDLNHWCEVFNLRADELREIVRDVGPQIDKVREYLVKRNLGREETF